jgi:S-DNA-T family DNA segregation ATPase FtsK/SpoIIIE
MAQNLKDSSGTILQAQKKAGLNNAYRTGLGSVAGPAERSSLDEYLHLTVFFAFLCLLLAVFTFHPNDPSDFLAVYRSLSAPAEAVEAQNLFGPFGANVAAWLVEIFGLMAPLSLVVFVLLIVDSVLLRRSSVRLVFRFAGLLQLAFFGAVLLASIRSPISFRDGFVNLSGFLGQQSYASIAGALGKHGALIMSAFGVVAALPLLLGVRLVDISRTALRLIPHRRVNEFVSALAENDSGSLLDSKEQLARPGRDILVHSPQLFNAGSPSMGSARPSGSAASGREHVILPRYQTEQVTVPSLNSAQLIQFLKSHEVEGFEARREQEKHRLFGEAESLIALLETFGVSGKVTRSQPGPVVNVHEFEPAAGVKVGKVLALQEDIALGLKARSVLMAPQPGKSTIGIELPAQFRETVSLKEVICSDEFQSSTRPLPMVLGKTVEGLPLVADLCAMPHLLIAGSTGSGKSVAINVILLSLLIARKPDELRLILVDPKMLELSNYDGIGHLLLPVVTEPGKAAGALKWALREMDRRYSLLKEAQVRNIEGYNLLDEDARAGAKLPYIVVVIDELCDLMMTAPKDVEDSVQRLAQKARASGIHLILATQRPSVDVLTGVIKANLPCRISFQVASKHDSRTIIEGIGAEKLLGKGDMLYLPPGTSKIMRAHGAFVSDTEVNDVCRALRETYPSRYEAGVMSEVELAAQSLQEAGSAGGRSAGAESDGEMSEEEIYSRAVDFALASGKVSTSSIQRQFRIGYNKAARIMDRMDREGLVGPSDVAGKPREVRMLK